MDIEGKTFTGAYLMNHGLEMPYRNEPEWNKKTDWSSRVLLLEESGM
jgi:alpha-galactosidase